MNFKVTGQKVLIQLEILHCNYRFKKLQTVKFWYSIKEQPLLPEKVIEILLPFPTMQSITLMFLYNNVTN